MSLCHPDGPNLEAGASPILNLESEELQPISMECQMEGNPTPSYVWYEISNNVSRGAMPYYGHQNPYGSQYPLQPPSNIPLPGLNVFSTERKIERIYQNSGRHLMQCQAQSRGRTVKQEFYIMVVRKLFDSTIIYKLKSHEITFQFNSCKNFF